MTGGDKISRQLFNFHVHAGNMNDQTPGPQSWPQFVLKIYPARMNPPDPEPMMSLDRAKQDCHQPPYGVGEKGECSPPLTFAGAITSFDQRLRALTHALLLANLQSSRPDRASVHGSRNAPSDSCVSISAPDSSNTRTIIPCERL